MNPRRGGFLIGKIHRLARRVFGGKLKKRGLSDINPAQGRILFVLWEKDNIPISELAKKTSLGKSTLTGMLDRLEKKGLVSRVRTPADRREILIQITQKNRAFRENYINVSTEMTELFYAGLTGTDIERFEKYLSRILENLEFAGKP